MIEEYANNEMSVSLNALNLSFSLAPLLLLPVKPSSDILSSSREFPEDALVDELGTMFPCEDCIRISDVSPG